MALSKRTSLFTTISLSARHAEDLDLGDEWTCLEGFFFFAKLFPIISRLFFFFSSFILKDLGCMDWGDR